MDQHPFTEEEFKEIFSRVPRLCVDLVIRSPRGVILTLRKHYAWHGQWHIPGGTVYYEETIEEAIRRVANEEIGVRVDIPKFLGYLEYPSERTERGFGRSISLVFLCDTTDTLFKRENHDASDIRAFSELPNSLISEQRAFLEAHSEWMK